MTKLWDYERAIALLPPGSCQEITNTLGHVLVDVTVDHNVKLMQVLFCIIILHMQGCIRTYSSMHDAIRHG